MLNVTVSYISPKVALSGEKAAHKRSVKTLQWPTHQRDWMRGRGQYCKRAQGQPRSFYEDLTLSTVSGDRWQTNASPWIPKPQQAVTSTTFPWINDYITRAVEVSHHNWNKKCLNQYLKCQPSWFSQLVWTTLGCFFLQGFRVLRQTCLFLLCVPFWPPKRGDGFVLRRLSSLPSKTLILWIRGEHLGLTLSALTSCQASNVNPFPDV